jgi:hypothetical protein
MESEDSRLLSDVFELVRDICVCVRARLCVRVFICVLMCVFMCVFMDIYIYIYIYIYISGDLKGESSPWSNARGDELSF